MDPNLSVPEPPGTMSRRRSSDDRSGGYAMGNAMDDDDDYNDMDASAVSHKSASQMQLEQDILAKQRGAASARRSNTTTSSSNSAARPGAHAVSAARQSQLEQDVQAKQRGMAPTARASATSRNTSATSAQKPSAGRTSAASQMTNDLKAKQRTGPAASMPGAVAVSGTAAGGLNEMEHYLRGKGDTAITGGASLPGAVSVSGGGDLNDMEHYLRGKSDTTTTGNMERRISAKERAFGSSTSVPGAVASQGGAIDQMERMIRSKNGASAVASTSTDPIAAMESQLLGISGTEFNGSNNMDLEENDLNIKRQAVAGRRNSPIYHRGHDSEIEMKEAKHAVAAARSARDRPGASPIHQMEQMLRGKPDDGLMAPASASMHGASHHSAHSKGGIGATSQHSDKEAKNGKNGPTIAKLPEALPVDEEQALPMIDEANQAREVLPRRATSSGRTSPRNSKGTQSVDL